MKKRTTSQSAFFYLRTSIGLLLVLAGVVLALFGISQFPAHAQARQNAATSGTNSLVPALFDCNQFRALGLDMQENLRAGAIAIYCGEAQGGSPDPEGESPSFAEEILAPLFGTADVDLITSADSFPNITQSETFTAANPDNPNEIVVAYNDSRGVNAFPINISGASVSTDGGNTFTRLTRGNGQSPFTNTFGDPVVLYNRPTATWFTVWLDAASGGQGLGGFKSTNPSDPNSWTHFTIHNNSGDDRESGWADNNPSSPFFGRMYVSWNDFNVGGSLKVRSSTNDGVTWGNEKTLSAGFIRNVQITGDLATGTVYVAGMEEGGGGLANRQNKIYRSNDGGATWTNTYTGPSFAAPGRTLCPNSYFACMYNTPQGGYWRHMGWGQPGALNGVVHYVYDSRNTGNGDPGNVFYIRSTNGGATFGAPVKLNTDSTTRAQWQPNISVAQDGSLLAVWYDERETSGNCIKGDTGTPCYRMWARKSLDNGATWLPDEPFSDVLSPLPGQPDRGIIAEYAGDYDYSSSVLNQHLHTWVDGRRAINTASQQDAFVDREPASIGGGGANLVSAASRLTHGSAGSFAIDMPLTGPSGVEDRDADGSFLAVFTFDAPVTSGAARIVGGTATAGTPTFSGNNMRVPLTGVVNQQIVTIRISNVNGGGGSENVDFGFLIADANANRTVARFDLSAVQGQIGQPVTAANFRADVIPDGTIRRNDALSVRAHRGESIP